MRLSTRTRRTDGVTLVACRLENDADEPRAALVENRLDGPARAPERHRSEDATLRVAVPAGATVGAGFSTPATPAEPAAAIVGTESVADSPGEAAVLDALSDPRPPHEAVVGADAEPERAEPTTDLDAVERRIERLEAVAAATTVPGAADALAREGGLDAVRDLDARVAADRKRLTALADRARRLAARAEVADPRVERLARLS
ncbi:hypothetical protein [Halosegnis marinus]|uniref:DUF8080 domain-containing protein n=1 Tax=Halosegnis marinus TaxID=3034023 RepID=A0ABD5ZPA0_9EURY|nr:hypothetical protein [Halosegnis sp. DT85]